MKYSYSCTVLFGNQSKLETETMKDNIIDFLKSFNHTDSMPEKVYDEDGSLQSPYYYRIELFFEHHTKLRVQRFSESLIAFCLFHHMALYED